MRASARAELGDASFAVCHSAEKRERDYFFDCIAGRQKSNVMSDMDGMAARKRASARAELRPKIIGAGLNDQVSRARMRNSMRGKFS